jgi:hypothetical protein
MFDRILVPLDRSPLAECVLLHAIYRALACPVHQSLSCTPSPDFGKAFQARKRLIPGARIGRIIVSYRCIVQSLSTRSHIPAEPSRT